MSLEKKQVFIKPKKAEVPVRKPEGGFVDAAGEDVERSGYWLRRINDGDVVLVPEKEADAIKKAWAEGKAKALAEQKKALAKANASTTKAEGE
ncbi:hypothetical protein C9J12_08325 [Photobacterium frigidiphilum]|uniref:DUF2635 domain-containing protein n=1 Tax=Photobacterium frigidiphilum TaxID=264736 RepID=A0A2T3JKD6_9GAMM|nr:DUF2635 domain-containing protein [Photobacterium frigidiphilum]PSU49484.1 hypothetical protein C9J12_08325 [Photobacterium frigidiphilum]